MSVDPIGLAPVVAVVIHDVAAPTWAACSKLAGQLDAIDPRLRKTWLVVPRYHDHAFGPRIVDALHCAHGRGDELALHGWRHLDDGVPRNARDRFVRRRYTAGEGEFAGLDGPQAAQRIALGRAWFARQGWPLYGFVPPAWLASDAAVAEIEQAGFGYTCSLAQLRVWKPRRTFDEGPRPALTHTSQSVVYSTRSAWRRAASCVWNAGVAWRQSSRWLLRIELHPGDALHPGVQRSWTRILERALREREPVTLAEAASRLIAWRERPQPVPAQLPSTPPITTVAPPVNAPVNAPASTSPG